MTALAIPAASMLGGSGRGDARAVHQGIGDPRRTLIKDLMGRRLNVGRQAQAVIVSALAWNAFFLGRSLKILKVYEGADPKVLGTPFDGSRK